MTQRDTIEILENAEARADSMPECTLLQLFAVEEYGDFDADRWFVGSEVDDDGEA